MQYSLASVLQNLLLEDPWPLGLMLIIATFVMAFLARQRGDRQLARCATLSLLLAGCIFLAAQLVTTNRELIIARTEKLVSHTAPLDVAAFKSYVSPRVTVSVGDDASAPTFTGNEVFDRLEKAVKNYLIQEQSIIEIDAQVRGEDSAVCQFDVRSDAKGGRVMTRWLLTWQKESDGNWRVTQVQWLDCPGMFGLKPGAQWLR